MQHGMQGGEPPPPRTAQSKLTSARPGSQPITVPGRESQDGRVPNSQLELDEAAAILERWAKEAEDRKRKSGPETGTNSERNESAELAAGLLALNKARRKLQETVIPQESGMSFYGSGSKTAQGTQPNSSGPSQLLPGLGFEPVSGADSGELPRLMPGAGPLGTRRSRRSSYSIGFGASFVGTPPALEDLQQSSQSRRRMSFRPFQKSSLAPDSLFGTPPGNNSYARDSTERLGVPGERPGSIGQPGLVSKVTFESNTGSEHTETTSKEPIAKFGVGGKIRRMIGRVASRAQLYTNSPPAPASMTPDTGDEDGGSAVHSGPLSSGHPAAMRSTLSQHLPPAALPVREDGSDIDEDEDGEEDGMTRRGPSELAPPTAKELALMGGQSPSFKRSLHKSIASYYSPLARLPPFVPRLLKEDMALNDAKYKAFDQCGARGLGAASKTLSPSMTEFQGAVMIADVKGFTQLTEILSKKGGGVEVLTNCMNEYFTRVINMILAFDGDVVKFAGDSMIVVFSPTAGEQQAPDLGLHAATERGLRCAHVLATRLGHMRMKMNGHIEPINVHGKEAVQDIDEAADDGGEGTRHNSGAAARARGARASISAVHTPLAAAAAAAAASAPGVPAPGTPSSLHPQLSSLPTASSTNLVGMGSLQSDSPRSSMAVLASGRGSLVSTGPASAQPSTRLPLMDTADGGELHAVGPPSGRASMVIATASSIASPAHTAGAAGSIGFNDPLASQGEMGSQGSPAGTGTPSSATGSFTRVKSRSWISNVMGRGKGGHKRSDMMGPHGGGAGHGSTGAPGQGGAGRYSEADVRSSAGSHMGSGNGFAPGGGSASGVLGSGKRSRARTEAGLLGAGGERGGTRGAAADAASLWGAESGGFARRELSLASKLNIPPPVRMIGNARPTSSLALSSGVALNTAYSMMSAGSGESGSLAGLQSFTGPDAAGPTSGTLGLHPRRSVAAPGESWASKLGNLQSGMLAGGEDMLVAERRRASYNMKPPGWEPLSEVPDEEAGGGSEGDNMLQDRSQDGPGSNGVQVSSPSRSRLSDIRKRIFGRKAASTTALANAALVEAPGSGAGTAPQQSNASQSNTSGSNAGAPQPSGPSQAANGDALQYEWSEDSYAVDALSSSFTNPRRPFRAGVPQTPANIGGYMAPSPLAKPGGPIAEGLVLLPPPQQDNSCSQQDIHQVLDMAAQPPAGCRSGYGRGRRRRPMCGPSAEARVLGNPSPLLLPGASQGQHQQVEPQDPYPLQQSPQERNPWQGEHQLPGPTQRYSRSTRRQQQHRAQRQEQDTTQLGYTGSGPVAEGVPWQRNSGLHDTSGGEPGSRTLLNKMTGWLTSQGAPRQGRESRHSMHDYSGHPGRGGGRHGQPGEASGDEGSLVSASGPSAGHPGTGERGPGGNASVEALPTPAAHTGLRMGGGDKPFGGGKARDPIIEEVQNSEFSLKIMLSAGSICIFHVGGDVDEVTDPTVPAVPRWEFFIGDRPLAPLCDKHQRRRCIAQLAAIEKHAEAGEVVSSREVIDLVQEDWDIEMLPDDVGRVHGPFRPFPMPTKGTPPAYQRTLTKQQSTASDHPSGRGASANGTALMDSDERASALARKALSANARTSNSGAATDAVLQGVANAVLIAPPPPSRPLPAASLGRAVSGSITAGSIGSPRSVAAGGGGLGQDGDGNDPDDETGARHEFTQLDELVQRRIAGLLRMHVLGSLRPRLEAGHLDFINEIRLLTCLFLGFPSLLDEKDTVSDADQLQAVQLAIQDVQQVMYKWDGSLLQFRCDEKGFVAICAFGLPGHTHEDNPSRGILAALELQKRTKQRQHRLCIGVTTGDLLCTCVGARNIRSEYTVFGDAINLSARLMVKCKNGMGDILCDEPTHSHARYKANYEELEPFMVKGKKQPVHVYRVAPYEDTGVVQGTGPGAGPERPLIGRDAEMAFILNRAANMVTGVATGGAIVIEGTTGMGKTKLLAEVRKSLERINSDLSAEQGKPEFHLFFGVADIANKSQKLHPWRRIFQEIFADDMARDGVAPAALPQNPAPKQYQRRNKGNSMDGDPDASSAAAPLTKLGDALASRIPSFNMDWRKHLAELLNIPLQYIPRGHPPAQDDFVSPLDSDSPALPLHLSQPAGGNSGGSGGTAQGPGPGANSSAGAPAHGSSSRGIVDKSSSDHQRDSAGGHAGLPNGLLMGGGGFTHHLMPAPQQQLGITSSSQATGAGAVGQPQVPRGRSLHRTGSSSGGDLPTSGGSVPAHALGGVGSVSLHSGGPSTGAAGMMERALGGMMAGLSTLAGTVGSRSVRHAPTMPPALTAQAAEFLETLTSGPIGGSLANERSSVDRHITMSAIAAANQSSAGEGRLSAPRDVVGHASGGGLSASQAPALVVAGSPPDPIPAPEKRSTGLGLFGTGGLTMGRTSAANRSPSHTAIPTSQLPPALMPTKSNVQAAMGLLSSGAGSGQQAGPGPGPAVAAAAAASLVGGGPGGASAGGPLRKNSLNFLVHIIREYTQLYGPTILLLENLHEFDTWSWQLLVKVAEVLSDFVLILATTRPNEPPAGSASQHLIGKAAVYQKVSMMYRHLLQLPTTSRVQLEPFNLHQTKALMKVVAENNYPDQYVLAIMEKTGGMPLYIEKVTEFLLQKPWLADEGGEFAANVNKMIRNLNFQQVIIERMDRLKPGIQLTLKVASVMGQWVDLDILHKFYPINKSKEELRAYLLELERGNFLKPTDTEGVWECNMVERDIVYEVIPHYQRRRLHAKLAQELERSLEEHHVATLTTIAYHWNQACMGHEVTEVECALKAIEYWQRAAEAAYAGSSLMEALRLFQKAAGIAEVLAESIGDSEHGGQHNADHGGGDQGGLGDLSSSGVAGDGLIGAGSGGSFSAVGPAFKGQLNWSLISRICRAQWEKSMASCCLGIVMQHQLEFRNQMEYWDTEDYFTLLTEHAIRGLMLLGAPHPRQVLSETVVKPWWSALCCGACGPSEDDELSGWQEGVVLQDQEVTEIRDILLVLIIAAERYSSLQDGEEYTRLLTFCKRVCRFFSKCSDTGLDPFLDIRSACSTRIRTFKSQKGSITAATDFQVTGPTVSALPGTLAAVRQRWQPV